MFAKKKNGSQTFLMFFHVSLSNALFSMRLASAYANALKKV